MKIITIKLNQEYKSFDQGFNYTFEGNLVLLSGVNGTGKSQLLNIILGKEGKNSSIEITSNITIDNVPIEYENIDYRSFKENIAITEITPSTSQSFMNSAQNAWNSYTRNLLNPNDQNNVQHSESVLIAKKLLIDTFSEQVFNSRQIEAEDFKNCLRSNSFIWKNGDVFTNSIGEIFFNHALKVSEEMKNVGRANFDNTQFETAPWVKLNSLFEELKLQYRFRSDYEIIGVEINEQPKLFALKADGSLDGNDVRQLKDLSDGEKTIISLCFASLGERTLSTKKLLLLDELDAVLNPSLIETFFSVIKRYFVDKGIAVILTTHSPATIGLSPDATKYYEVFKPNDTGNRIFEVNRDDYSELQIVNKEFYTKIYDQESRIRVLEGQITSTEEILIITEGKTDWKYMISALKYFHAKGEFEHITPDHFYRFGSQSELDEAICDTQSVNELSDSKLNNFLKSLIASRDIDTSDIEKTRIGIYDSDTNTKTINNTSLGVYSFKIEPDNISTELLFSEDEIKTELDGKRLFIGTEFDQRTKINTENLELSLGGDSQNTNKAGKRVIIDSDVYNRTPVNVALPKEQFAQGIYKEEIAISEQSWENFRHIFDSISAIVPPTQEEEDNK